MFQSIWDGLKLMCDWHIWVALALFAVLSAMQFYFMSKVFIKEDVYGDEKLKGGCFTSLFNYALVAIITSFTVTLILPILAGGSEFIKLDFFQEFWWLIIKAGLLAALIAMLISLIPFIGGSPGVTFFLQGAIIYHILLNALFEGTIKKIGFTNSLFPSFFIVLGFLIISVIICVGIYFLIATLLLKIFKSNLEAQELIKVLAPIVIGGLNGMLCLCIYCSYLNDAIKDKLIGV